MARQIAKGIGSAEVVFRGNLEAIVPTGGMADSGLMIDEISKHISFLGEITVVAGELEKEALAAAGVRSLTGDEKLKRCWEG